MPGGNRMGPVGMGPRTGAGLWAGYGVPGYMNRGFGGRCFGRGWRAGMFQASGVPAGYEQANPGMEREYLLNQTGVLKRQLSVIEKRLAELETGKKETV